MRVSPELIEASTGTSRWQQPFDGDVSGVFQMQADIAARVAEALERRARRRRSNEPGREADDQRGGL